MNATTATTMSTSTAPRYRTPSSEQSHGRAKPRLEVLDPGDDLPAHDLERLDVGRASDRTEGGLDPGVRQLRQVLHHPVHAPPVPAHVDRVHGGLLDRAEVSPLPLAVFAQHPELAPDLAGAGEQVARIGVLRHQAERLPLAAAADQDPRVRTRQGLRRIEGLAKPVVLALE